MIKQTIKNVVEQFPRAAQFYRNSRDLLDRNSPALQTPWGFTLAGHPTMASGAFEPEETNLVCELLQNVDVLVNVGANIGYYCCHALSMGKTVMAIEPNSRNLHFLMRNIAENGWAQQAEVFPVALSEKADILKMWGGGTGASLVKGWAGIPESYVTQVPVLTLDRILGCSLEGRRALILVDVEGAEYAMLKGAAKALRHEPRPIWFVEIGSTSHQPSGTAINPYLSQTFDLFFRHGYAAETADSERLVVDAEAVEQAAQGVGMFATHNFVFR